MRIATWNVNSLNVRLPHVLDWLVEQTPDVLCLQETKLTDEKFPVAAIVEAGYEVVFAGQKTYNGVAILSKFPLTEVVTEFPGFNDPQRRILGATINGVRVLNLYVPNGSSVGSDKYAYKLDWLAHLDDFIEQEITAHEKLVVVGDFNIAPTDIDVHDPAAWRGEVLCSAKERAALKAVLDHGLVDVFRAKHDSVEYSWWDYRQAAFRRNLGMRIDLILANDSYAVTCDDVFIDKAPRQLERPSDHAPVLASFA